MLDHGKTVLFHWTILAGKYWNFQRNCTYFNGIPYDIPVEYGIPLVNQFKMSVLPLGMSGIPLGIYRILLERLWYSTGQFEKINTNTIYSMIFQWNTSGIPVENEWFYHWNWVVIRWKFNTIGKTVLFHWRIWTEKYWKFLWNTIYSTGIPYDIFQWNMEYLSYTNLKWAY